MPAAREAAILEGGLQVRYLPGSIVPPQICAYSAASGRKQGSSFSIMT
jgi:hypothetical protein